MRILIVLGAALLSGCTVGWLDLRVEQAGESSWKCPSEIQVTYSSGIYTNTFGEKKATPDEDREAARQYEVVARKVVADLGCGVSTRNEPLEIEIERLQHISALPQEWLTGLSFGLIPSWGTRTAEARFIFKQGNKVGSYVVDDNV